MLTAHVLRTSAVQPLQALRHMLAFTATCKTQVKAAAVLRQQPYPHEDQHLLDHLGTCCIERMSNASHPCNGVGIDAESCV